MDEIEQKTIKAFIIREKQARYIYLLSTPKKRRTGVGRLNHCTDMDARYVQWLGHGTDVEAVLRSAGCPNTVYVMSSAEEIDGRTLPLKEALDLVVQHGWGTIVSCIPGRLAYYYDELGERRAILKRNV